MTIQEAIAEAKRRWPDSNLHNAYETITTSFPGYHHSKKQYHVVAYNPLRSGSGHSWETAFADAQCREETGEAGDKAPSLAYYNLRDRTWEEMEAGNDITFISSR